VIKGDLFYFICTATNEDGSFTSIDASDEGAPFADPYLRIYPRQVTLEPKEGQSIVLQVRRTVNMPENIVLIFIFVLRMTTLHLVKKQMIL
jgi:hypothetical protein